MRLGRRAFLSMLAATAGMPGCQRPSGPAPRPETVTLRLPVPVSGELQEAYLRRRPNVLIDCVEETGDGTAILLGPPATPLLGALEPLDDALRTANFAGQGLIQGTATAFRWIGQTYGLPVTARPLGWSSDLRALAARGLGLEAPQPDWTGDDLLTLAGRLAERAQPGDPPAVGGIPYGHPWVWAGYLAAAGLDAFAGGQWAIATPATASALVPLVALVATCGWADSPSPQGTAAPVLRLTCPVTPTPTGPVGWWPSMPGGPQGWPVITFGLGLPRGAPHVAEFVAFLLWLHEPAQQLLWADNLLAPVSDQDGPWRRWFSVHGTAPPPGFDPARLVAALAGWPGGAVRWPAASGRSAADPYWAAAASAVVLAARSGVPLPGLLAGAQADGDAALATLGPAGTTVRDAFWVPPSGPV